MAQAEMPVTTAAPSIPLCVSAHMPGRELVYIRDLPRGRGSPMVPIEREPRRRKRSLADDVGFAVAAYSAGLSAATDPDLELGSWPDIVDQTKLGLVMSGSWHEDDEADDCDTGIDDEPHDALTEDGY